MQSLNETKAGGKLHDQVDDRNAGDYGTDQAI